MTSAAYQNHSVDLAAIFGLFVEHILYLDEHRGQHILRQLFKAAAGDGQIGVSAFADLHVLDHSLFHIGKRMFGVFHLTQKHLFITRVLELVALLQQQINRFIVQAPGKITTTAVLRKTAVGPYLIRFALASCSDNGKIEGSVAKVKYENGKFVQIGLFIGGIIL